LDFYNQRKGAGIIEDDFYLRVSNGVDDVWVKSSPTIDVSLSSPDGLIKKGKLVDQKIDSVILCIILMESHDTLFHKNLYQNKFIYRESFTCPNFHKKLKKNDQLYLKVNYNLDSSKVIVPKTFEYILKKGRIISNFRLG
jgi:hypothetical protein